MRIPFLFMAMMVFAISCKEKAEAYDEAVSVSEVNLIVPKDKSHEVDYEVPVDSAAANAESSPSKMQIKVIKTANLSFESSDLNVTYENLLKGVSKYNAIVQNDASGKNDASIYRNLTIRIPNQHFDAFIAEISKGVSHFDRKEISQQDVTEEYIDVESRMKSKKKLEERYLQLLSKANKVAEMLEIEKKLAEIREEIEAKEGQLKYIQNRVSMSTVQIEMYTRNASESGATISYGSKIWNSIKEGFNGLSNFMLSIISIWPFILIFVGLFVFIKRRFFKKKE